MDLGLHGVYSEV